MNFEKKHIDPEDPECKAPLLLKAYDGEHWRTPLFYFEDAECKITANIDAHQTADDAFFEEQARAIQSQLKLEQWPMADGFEVPEQYFESLHAAVISRQAESKTKVVSMKPRTSQILVFVASVAALLVVGFFMFKPEPPAKMAFAEIYNQDPLQEEDMNILIEDADDDLIEIMADDLLVSDTLIVDSLQKKTPTDLKPLPAKKPQTPADSKKKKEAKSEKKPSKVNWDELKDEDLLYYLNENNDDDSDL